MKIVIIYILYLSYTILVHSELLVFRVRQKERESIEPVLHLYFSLKNTRHSYCTSNNNSMVLPLLSRLDSTNWYASTLQFVLHRDNYAYLFYHQNFI